LRSRGADVTFIAGCACVVGAFASVSLFAGLLSAGLALGGLSILYDRGGEKE